MSYRCRKYINVVYCGSPLPISLFSFHASRHFFSLTWIPWKLSWTPGGPFLTIYFIGIMPYKYKNLIDDCLASDQFVYNYRYFLHVIVVMILWRCSNTTLVFLIRTCKPFMRIVYYRLEGEGVIFKFAFQNLNQSQIRRAYAEKTYRRAVRNRHALVP